MFFYVVTNEILTRTGLHSITRPLQCTKIAESYKIQNNVSRPRQVYWLHTLDVVLINTDDIVSDPIRPNMPCGKWVEFGSNPANQRTLVGWTANSDHISIT